MRLHVNVYSSTHVYARQRLCARINDLQYMPMHVKARVRTSTLARTRTSKFACVSEEIKKKKKLGAQIGSSLNRNLRKFSLSHCYHRNRLTPIALLGKPVDSPRVADGTR